MSQFVFQTRFYKAHHSFVQVVFLSLHEYAEILPSMALNNSWCSIQVKVSRSAFLVKLESVEVAIEECCLGDHGLSSVFAKAYALKVYQLALRNPQSGSLCWLVP